jgi:hypothetical protein
MTSPLNLYKVGAALTVDVLKYNPPTMEAIIRVTERFVLFIQYARELDVYGHLPLPLTTSMLSPVNEYAVSFTCLKVYTFLLGTLKKN